MGFLLYFKQKTAYEMLISDWSSDVCSSDLTPFQAQSRDNVPSLDQFTQESRIASNNSGGLGYQFGAFYFDEKLDISSFEFGGPTDANPSALAVPRPDSEAYGIFGPVNYEIQGGFKLPACARHNHDTREFFPSRPETGRASRRGRVFEYVSITVGA